MKIKSYFATSIDAAMSKARQELGPDAMLVSTRKAMPEARHLGEYEAVFADAQEPANTAVARNDTADRTKGDSSLSGSVAALRVQIEQMAASLARFSQPPAVSPMLNASVLNTSMLNTPLLASIYSSLIGSEMYPELAQAVMSGVRMRGENLTIDRVRQALREEVSAYCRVAPTIAAAGSQRRVVAVVGPPGSGKTTTLVKLAVRFGLSRRIPTQLLTLDLDRIAAADQLQTFASILGVGFQAVQTPYMLSQALEEHRSKGLILIDTPGYGAKEQEAGAALASVLAREDIEVHLVLPASLKAPDLSSIVDRFTDFHPAKLLFTRIDETRTYGCIFNELARTGLPVSFLANGQQIPEDLTAPTSRDITDLILNGLCGRASAVAAA